MALGTGAARTSADITDEARSLWRDVDRPNLVVKVAPTAAGLAATVECLAQGISVNVAPIVSPGQYRQVIDVFLIGLERARAAGRPLAPIVSVAAMVSMAATEAADLFDAAFSSDRWHALATAGARPQRQVWERERAPGRGREGFGPSGSLLEAIGVQLGRNLRALGTSPRTRLWTEHVK